MIDHHVRPDGLPEPNGYSHSVSATGRLIAVSGQLPLDESGALVGAGDAYRQAQQVFGNLARALAGAGADVRHVVKLNYFVLDVADVTAVRTARDELYGSEPRPASALVQVAGLLVPGALLEVDALAVVPH